MRPVPAFGFRLRRRLALAALALILAAGAIAPGSAQAKRIFVPRDHKRLQAAIDAASTGDTVWVAKGTYYGPFVIKKQLVLFGEDGPEETILDGHDSVRVLHVEGVARGAIFGFRIQNGKAPGGGGIYCLRDTALVIGSCVIQSNFQAGVAAWQCGPLQIANSQISGNKGSGLTASDSRVQLFKVNFRDNQSPTGGGVSLVSTELIARDCLFEENRAGGGTGGGIYGESSPVRVMNFRFRGNSAAAGGGAVAVRDSGDLRIRNSFFAANHSSTGGAILTDLSSLDVQSSIFTKNRSTAAGSAIQILGRRVAGVNPILSNNTFYRNGVDAEEGAALFVMEVAPEIIRNIFVVDSTSKNKAVLEMKGVPRYECNLFYAMDGRGAPPAATNTIVGNPSFCDAENEDFHVHDLSPALVALCGRLGALGKGCSSFRILPSQ